MYCYFFLLHRGSHETEILYWVEAGILQRGSGKALHIREFDQNFV